LEINMLSRKSEVPTEWHARMASAARGAVFAMAIGLGACAPMARHFMETKALTTGPNGPQTPADSGAPFQRIAIPSGPRHLDSYVVTAPSTCPNAPVLLIYHGVQETISLWGGAQAFLYRNCVSSVVFDYTGSGDSSRPARLAAVNEDAGAAYAFARSRFPHSRLFVMGHSMGSGPMLEALPTFATPPDGVIVASPFASLRAYGERAGGFYGLLARLTPDWWDNVRNIRKVSVPVLVVHSADDAVNPVAEGRQVFEAARQPKQLVTPRGYTHNALYRTPQGGWWTPVLSFLSHAER
jgi:alpha-beta hydrolase superfamily lysophospholipase